MLVSHSSAYCFCISLIDLSERLNSNSFFIKQAFGRISFSWRNDDLLRGSIVSVIPGSWLPNVWERLMPFNLQKVLNTENECYSPLWKWTGRQRGRQKLNKPCCLSHQRWKILWEQWEPVEAGTQRSGPELAALGWVPSSVTLPPMWPPANCSVPPISGGPCLSSSSLLTSTDCL